MPLHVPYEINMELVTSKLSEIVRTNRIRPIYSSITNIQKKVSSDNTSFSTVKLVAKNGKNLSFFRLKGKNTTKVINKVIAPAFLTDGNYNYLYQKSQDRKLAVYDRFNNLIPTLIKSKTVNSYILFDEDEYEPIGHVLLYSPINNKEGDSSNDHESTSRKFSRQLLKISNKMNTFLKMVYLSFAMDNEYKLINKFINCGYWEISCVSIDPLIQSVGYGTIIMKNIHNIIKSNNSERGKYNVPIILFTATPDALRFYKRLGYKVFMEHSINDEVTSYSLIYHDDEKVLEKWLTYLAENIPYFHKVDRFSFMPSFITSKIIKKPQQNDQYLLPINYFFEY